MTGRSKGIGSGGLAIVATGNRRTPVNQPSKPFNIDKRQVYEAYLQVRSNSGAAGVDGVTIEQFESNLKGNLSRSGIG